MVGRGFVRTVVATLAAVAVVGVAGPVAPAGAAPAKAKSIVVTASPSTAVWSQAVRLTAAITPKGGGAPKGGTVTFLDGDATIATATATARNTVVTTTALAPGEHQVRVSYGGDVATSAGTSAPITVTVAPAPTTISLTAGGTIDPGTPATIKATVRPTSPASATGRPTGAVTFTRGASTVTIPLNSNGVATWRPTLSTPGRQRITASYVGTDHYAPSGPATADQLVRGRVADQASGDGFVSAGSIENGGSFWMEKAQLFTAGVTGDLDGVGLTVFWGQYGATPPGDLLVTIQTVDGGVPTGTVLGSGSLSTSGLPEDGRTAVEIPLTTSAPVTAGVQYALVLATAHQPSSSGFWQLDMVEGGYPPGALLGRSAYSGWEGEYYDLVFTTWVTIS